MPDPQQRKVISMFFTPEIFVGQVSCSNVNSGGCISIHIQSAEPLPLNSTALLEILHRGGTVRHLHLVWLHTIRSMAPQCMHDVCSNLQALSGVQVSVGWVSADVLLGNFECLLHFNLACFPTHPYKDL